MNQRPGQARPNASYFLPSGASHLKYHYYYNYYKNNVNATPFRDKTNSKTFER